MIHQLIDKKDLENKMPTLDKSSHPTIPNLGYSEAIVTGNVIQITVLFME